MNSGHRFGIAARSLILAAAFLAPPLALLLLPVLAPLYLWLAG